MQAERAELFPEIGGKEIAGVDVGGARRDLVVGELLHAVAQHGDRLAEIEGEAGQVGHDDRLRKLFLMTDLKPNASVNWLPIRLSPGQDARRALEDALKEAQARAAFVLSGIGSLSEAHLRGAPQML